MESKLLSDRKSGKERPATDVISDCFFQIILRMQLRTIGESQLVNVENMLDTMPAIGVDFHASMNGPIIAFDRGYGKVFFINLLMQRNYRTIRESQLVNVENILDNMPAIGVDFCASMNGPIIAFDWGYGKVFFINLLMQRN